MLLSAVGKQSKETNFNNLHFTQALNKHGVGAMCLQFRSIFVSLLIVSR
jgi:hypothetical protein